LEIVERRRLVRKAHRLPEGVAQHLKRQPSVTPTCSREFHKIDDYVFLRLLRWFGRRGGQRSHRRTMWTNADFYGMGLYQLRKTVRYAAQAAPERSSLSRMREIRTYGLKGGYMETGRQQ